MILNKLKFIGRDYAGCKHFSCCVCVREMSKAALIPINIILLIYSK